MKLTKTRLIVSIVLAVVLASAITGGAIWFAVTQKPNSTASTNTARLFSDNLLSSGTTIKGGNARKLVNAVGGEGSSIVKNWAELKADNDGNPIIFKMGTIPGTSTELEWEVVYRNGDYITLWLTKNYTYDIFNTYSSTSGSLTAAHYSLIKEHYTSIKGASADASTYLQQNNYGSSSSTYSNYSKSYLRDLTSAIYYDLVDSDAYPILDELIVSPSDAGQTYQEGSATSGETNTPTQYRYSTSGTTYYSHHNGLKNQTSLDTQYYTYTWDSTAYEDKFWIPSYYEVWNKGTGTTSSTSGKQYFDGGYWGFSSTDDVKFNTSCYDGSGTTSYCWLRSGFC